jgi:hypothetical protein
VGAFAPLAHSCGGGKGDNTWGERGSAHRQAAYERGDARHRGTGVRRGDDRECGGRHAGHGRNVRRAPDEEEARILHPELGDRSPIRHIFKMSDS